MIRRYCDCCDVDVTDQNAVSSRIEGETVVAGKTVLFQLTLGVGANWNEGELCDSCALIALLGEKRARCVLGNIAKSFGMSLDVDDVHASPDVGFGSHGFTEHGTKTIKLLADDETAPF